MKAKVLVVDDSPDIALLLVRLLELQGCDVAVAPDGQQGLVLAERFQPDVALLDVMMPGMDGMELCQRLKAQHEGLYVILVTAMSDNKDVVRGLDAGADEYITKPFSKEVLAARLRSGLRIKAHRDALASANRRLLEEIAERRRAEAEAQSLRRRIEFVLEATRTGLDVIDADLNVRYIDPARRRLYGDPAGRKCYEYFCGRDTHCQDCGVRRALQTGQQVVSQRVFPGEPDRPVEVISFPFHEGDGTRLVAQVSVDLSQRKLLEAQTLRAQRLEALGRLAAGLAHEINTPNQYVTDNLRFLQAACHQMGAVLEAFRRLAEAPEVRAARPELVQAVWDALAAAELDELRRDIPQAIADALSGVAEVSRVVAAVQKFASHGQTQKTLADLNEVVSNALEVGRLEWRQTAEVEADLDPRLPPVSCLPSAIAEAVVELVRGAAAAPESANGQPPAGSRTAGRTRVRLCTRGEPGHAVIEVDDDGPPIPLAQRDRLFDPLVPSRAPNGLPQRTLAFVHAVVVQGHGGSVEVSESPLGGTRVTLRLPSADHGAPAGTGSPMVAVPAPLACPTETA